MSKSAIVGLLSGLTVVVVTMIVVAVVNLPEAEGAVSGLARGPAQCHTVQVAQDQGYGIARNVVRNVCESTLNH